MIKTYLTMLKADEGMVLTDGTNYCSSVLLREGQTEEGWSEITQEEYEEIMKQQEEEESSSATEEGNETQPEETI